MSISKQPQSKLLLDGEDLSGLLLNQEALKSRDLFWHFPVYLQARNSNTDQAQEPLFRTRPGSAMRSGNWKLIHYFENDEYELYDLSVDLAESNNLALEQLSKLYELRAKLDDWRTQTGAPIPTRLNPEYKEEVNQKLMLEALSQVK